MAKEIDDDNFGVDNTTEAPRHRNEFRVLHMAPEQRLPVYLAVIGLMKAGYGIEDAARMIALEYDVKDDRQAMQGKAVLHFFERVSELKDENEVVRLAIEAFGKPFLYPEERALLRGLVSGHRVQILEAAADVLKHRDNGTAVRPGR